MALHAKLAPSAAHRWLQCPGSIAACDGLPSTDSKYSREGTFAHAIAATALRDRVPAAQFIGRTDGEFTCDREMAQHVQSYLDVVHELELLEEGSVLIEEQVTVSPECWGTADAVILSADPPRVHVVDFKFGAGICVPVVGNEQLLTYAYAAIRGFWRADLIAGPGEVAHLHIVQPRRPDADGEVHRTAVVSGVELTKFSTRLWLGMVAALRPGALRHAGDWCQFCPAKASCPELRAAGLRAAQDVFPKGDPLLPVTPPHPTTFSSAQLGQMLPTLAIVETWISAVRDHALDQARQGHVPPGWKLVETIGNRRWLIEDAEVATALSAIGCDPWAPRELLSPAQAEKRIGKRAAGIVSRMTTRPVTGEKLVPVGDKRPAVASAASVFPRLPEGAT